MLITLRHWKVTAAVAGVDEHGCGLGLLQVLPLLKPLHVQLLHVLPPAAAARTAAGELDLD